jgi:CubicO group peptidase (beta-lactamase class C family)
MPWSVSKGIAAAGLLSCVDRGLVSYTQPVADIWPEFAAKGKHTISVQDAVSHRIGTTGLPTLAMLYDGRHDMERLWARGLRFVEQDKAPPQKQQQSPRAAYVPVTWSWVMGGIVQGASSGKHIRHVVRDELGIPLKVDDELMLGCFPNGHVAEKLLTKAQMPRARTLLWPRGVRDVMTLRWAKRVAAFVESCLLVTAANSDFIRLHCLPSSNGFFTAVSTYYQKVHDRFIPIFAQFGSSFVSIEWENDRSTPSLLV